MPARPDDAFWIDLTLRHRDGNPDEYTQALGILHRHSARAASRMGSITRKATLWIATLHEGRGKGDNALSFGLQEAVETLAKSENFPRTFSNAGGQSWIAINHAVGFDAGVLSEITLEPLFLSRLVKCDLALVMRCWTSDNWPELEAGEGTLRKENFEG